MAIDDLRKIGSISLLDLDTISKSYGRDFMPFPFMATQPSRFSFHHEYLEYARSVPDRFNNGDLHVFHECVTAYGNADIRVEFHVQYIPADTASVRVLAYRFDQAGFLAQQRPDDDIVDIYELSPYLLGPAVADRAAVDKPGRRSAIVVPEYAPDSKEAGASDNTPVHHMAEPTPSAVEVPSAEVTAFSTVQSHWRPTRYWGLDQGKDHAVWIRIRDDGDYLYTRDFSEAKPMTRPMLAERIDRLISDDVKALRQFRGQ